MFGSAARAAIYGAYLRGSKPWVEIGRTDRVVSTSIISPSLEAVSANPCAQFEIPSIQFAWYASLRTLVVVEGRSRRSRVRVRDAVALPDSPPSPFALWLYLASLINCFSWDFFIATRLVYSGITKNLEARTRSDNVHESSATRGFLQDPRGQDSLDVRRGKPITAYIRVSIT